jgi:pseudaminic acid cytidylyltransferase
MTCLCIIPARAGSVRIPMKNIKPFKGSPIIAYSIRTAQNAGIFDDVIVSTDDGRIATVAMQYGANIWLRPADDGTKGTQEVAADIIKRVHNCHVACVIYPCAPLLRPSDVRRGLVMLASSTKDYAFAIGREPLRDAGCIYWGWSAAFRADRPLMAQGNSVLFTLPEERVCDINTIEDWWRAEALFDRLRGEDEE